MNKMATETTTEKKDINPLSSMIIKVILTLPPGPHYFNLFSSLNKVSRHQPLSAEEQHSLKKTLKEKRRLLIEEGGLQREILEFIRHFVNQENKLIFDENKGFFWNQAESHNSKKLIDLRNGLIKAKSLQKRWQNEKLILTPFLLSINQWFIAALIVLGKEDKPASVDYFYNLIQKSAHDSSKIPLLSDNQKILQLNASIRDLITLSQRVLEFEVTKTSLQSSSELQVQLKWLDNALAWVDQLPHHRAGVSTRIRFAFG